MNIFFIVSACAHSLYGHIRIKIDHECILKSNGSKFTTLSICFSISFENEQTLTTAAFTLRIT